MMIYNYFYLQEYKLPAILFIIKSWKKTAKKRYNEEKKEVAKKEGICNTMATWL